MTPEESQTLTAIDTKLQVFMATCKTCRKEVAGHTLDLEGRHGNSESRGLKAEVVAMKVVQASTKRSQNRQLLWFQTQITIVIAALLAMVKSTLGR